jgi:hypothetical protein
MNDNLPFIYPADIDSKSLFMQSRGNIDWLIESSRELLRSQPIMKDVNVVIGELVRKMHKSHAGIRLFMI